MWKLVWDGRNIFWTVGKFGNAYFQEVEYINSKSDLTKPAKLFITSSLIPLQLEVPSRDTETAITVHLQTICLAAWVLNLQNPLIFSSAFSIFWRLYFRGQWQVRRRYLV